MNVATQVCGGRKGVSPVNWYQELAWRIHVWVRPEPGSYPILPARLADWIVSIVFPIWYSGWSKERKD